MSKLCSKCKQVKPDDEFYPSQRTQGWARCKTCFRSYYSTEESRKRVKAWNRKWYKKNRAHANKMANKWRSDNREHYRKWQSEYGKANRRKFREYNLKRNYGITVDDYEQMLKDQDGHCACCTSTKGCGRTNALHVDHCHLSNTVRGLLCADCNLMIGKLRDSVGVAINMAGYLYRTASIEGFTSRRPHLTEQAKVLIRATIKYAYN